MKLDQIYGDNLLGVKSVQIALHEAVQLIVGPNASGKSSMKDGLRLALTGDLTRVSLKKEATHLIHDGADAAVFGVHTADGDEYHVTIGASGKITASKLPDAPLLPYVLDAQRFAHLGSKERSAFLFGLMGVKMDGPAIKQRLLDKGCNPAKIDRVAPMLRSGFEAACADAKAKATEAKGAWRAVTGENYGSEKAKTWAATIPEHDAKAHKELNTELQHLDVALDKWLQEVGKAKAETQRRAELKAKLPGLKERAGRIERIQTKLDKDSQELADWQADLEKTRAAAGETQLVGVVHDLARAANFLMNLRSDSTGVAGYHMNGEIASWDEFDEMNVAASALQAYEAEHGKVQRDGEELVQDAKAAARLPAIRHSVDLLTKAVANDRRDLEVAKQAQAEVAAIEADLAQQFDEQAGTSAQQQVDELKGKRATLVQKLDALSSLKKQAEAAEKKTADALAHHLDVAAWEQVGDALAPDGIPRDLLAEALGPINDRLAQHAADATWPQVVIGSDMAITADGRDYRLLSESEQWRVDAMLAESVAHLSGLRLLVLDRFDVLDLPARSQLLNWLDILADAGEIDTALVFGTLKALPSGLPPTIAAHWIEGGVVEQLQEAA